LATYNHYPLGQSVTVVGTFTNAVTKVVVDPSNALLDVLDPAGKVTTYTYQLGQVTKASTGAYQYAIDTTALAGRWQYRWYSPAGSPLVAAAGFNSFIVDEWPVATP
jgi:hypothetical protein